MIVLAGRAAAERLMVDTCTITREATTGQTYNAANDTFSEPARSTIYSGPCRVKPAGAGDRRASAGDDTYQLDAYVVSIPVSATAVEPGDQVAITAAQHDPTLTGVGLRVLSVDIGSQITARRLRCEVTR